jgi:hypothetical protein
VAEHLAQPAKRRLVQRSSGAQNRGEPPILPGRCDARHHDAPEVATGAPDVADGAEADDEEDEDEEDEDEEDEDEDPLAGVAAVELTAPAVAAPRCAEAGRATAIAAAVAALSTPAPAVTAASLVLPRRRFRLALASLTSADSWAGSASAYS